MEVTTIIDIAKTSIKMKVLNTKDWLPNVDDNQYLDLRENQGAFTTLYTLNGALRGCIGVPYPTYPLCHSIAISARKAAVSDPRFPSVSKNELESIYIEVETLSPIIKIEFQDEKTLIDQIDVGKHGLIVKYHQHTGLLLPKVGARYNWNALELVQNTCQKAGLPKSVYLEDGIEYYNFTSTLFSEKSIPDK